MGQRQLEPADAPTIADAARRLDVADVAGVARAAYESAGELAAREYGRAAAVLGAVRLATRRSRRRTLDRERIASAFDVDPDRVVAADAEIASALTPPADADEIRSLRRRLIVARELLAAAERDRIHALRLSNTYLADAAPWLVGRASREATRSDGPGAGALEESRLRAHVDRLEADLELARLGTELYVAREDRDRDRA